jgi:hypothetical protein
MSAFIFIRRIDVVAKLCEGVIFICHVVKVAHVLIIATAQ